jgi:hypothetical protein
MEILYYAFVFYLGWVAREKYAQRQMNKFLKTIEYTKIEDEIEDSVVLLLVKHSDNIYAYDEKDNTFLTQGKDFEEIVANLTKYFPDKSFKARPDNLKEMDI